jgi:ParB family chromosome partitioning protein
MTNITSIPLTKLVVADANARKTAGADTALLELAASIAAHGLLQSLVGRKSKKARFALVAGGRRLAALRLLVDDGRIEADYGVPCRMLGSGVDAVEISLAENSVREAMHPADEFEAFRTLIDGGMSREIRRHVLHPSAPPTATIHPTTNFALVVMLLVLRFVYIVDSGVTVTLSV